MGKEAPSAPAVPNPQVVAQAQTTSNLATAQAQSQLNNTNVVSPYGTVSYAQPGGADTQYTQTTQLSPAEQQIFNAQTADQGQAAQIAGQQLGNVSNALNTPVTAPTMQTGVQNGPIATGYNSGGPIQGQVSSVGTDPAILQAENAAYGTATQYLNPQWQQATEQNQAQLTAQGLNPNDAAYQNAQTIFGGQENQAYQGAINAATAAGQAEQNTLYGQNLQSGQFANAAQAQQNTQNASQAGFQNTAQQQQNSEALANAQLNNQAQQSDFTNQAYAQELPINEFNSLMSSGQVQAPSSTPAQTAVAPTDVTGAYALSQQQANANYQAQLAQYNSGLSGLFSLGSAAALAL